MNQTEGMVKTGGAFYNLTQGKDGVALKNYFSLALVLGILLAGISNTLAQDKHLVFCQPERYKIVLLKPLESKLTSRFNEVILLDTDTGRTWTLKTHNLVDGWVLMPQREEPRKNPD